MKKQNGSDHRDKKSLKIVALGGAGGMGQFAVETAKEFDFVKEIVIADYDEKRAEKLADSYGRKVSAAKADANDPNHLYSLMKGADVVMSTLGPYFKYGVSVLQTAIDAGCDYIDICDDWEPTLEMLKLDAQAKEKGVTAVVGVGASPGISNLLAVKIINDLDWVDDLITGWGDGDRRKSSFDIPGQGGSYSAAIEHLVHQVSTEIKVWKDGALRTVKPVERIKIDYPGEVKKTAYTVGHPEPVTLYKLRPEIRNCLNVMDLPKEFVNPMYWLIDQIQNKRMTIKKAVKNMLAVERGIIPMLTNRFGRKIFMTAVMMEFRSRRVRPLPGLFAYATGQKDGKPARVSAHLNAKPYGGLAKDTMGSITGVPLAVGLHLFDNMERKKPGVFPPESILDPDAFFDVLAPLCTPSQQDADELVIKRLAWG